MLPIDYLIELINNRNLIFSLNFNKDDLNLESYRVFIEEKIIIKEIEGIIYLKLRILEEYDQVSREIIETRFNSEKITIDTSLFTDILTKSLAKSGIDTNPDFKENYKDIFDEKLSALIKMSVNKVSVLVGDAGTGKTTALSNLCEHKDIQSSVLLLAPTGKARVRMWDATGKQFKTNTIAGFLIDDKCYDSNSRRYIIPEKSKPELAGANVIIDESSMLTTEMFAAVLKSCSQAARIIFVGDPNQLPPIGCGKPFSDLVDYLKVNYPDNVASLSCVMRTEMSETNVFASWFKNNSKSDERVFDKIENNNDLLKGIRFRQYKDNLQEVIFDEIKNITSMKDIDDILRFDISLGARIVESNVYFNNGGIKAFNIPIDQGAGSKAENWQILSPVKNSPDGTFGINDLIHSKYRPTKYFKGKEVNNYYSNVEGLQKIGVGDKVICTDNGHSDPYPLNNFNYIANGEIGIRVSPVKGTDFPNVEFSTQLGVSYWGHKIKGYMKRWKYKGDESDGNLELAYAITIHKAQGSQFKNVILVLNKNSGMLSRELIYTAITRQRTGLVILFNDEIRSLLKYSSDLHSILAKRCTDLFCSPKYIKLSEGWYEEAKIHKTERGEMVRSKSEVVIANMLYNAKLDYSYENDGHFIIIDGKKLLPDFVILHKDKKYYWEHLGMLNNVKYRKDWAEKKALYLSDESINLRTTEDKANGAINCDDVLKIIDEIKNG